MSKKILLNVTLPATKKAYEMRVPASMALHEASIFMCEILSSREKSWFSATKHNVFMQKDSGEILDHSKTIAELDLVNGAQLVLV